MRTPLRTRRRSLARRLLAVSAVVAGLTFAGGASGAVVATGFQAAAARAPQASSQARAITRMDEFEAQLFDAINEVRREQGVEPLRPNPGLAVAATRHSVSMAEFGFFEHASLDGSPFWKRVEAVYPKGGHRFWSVGENLVWGSPQLSARQAIGMWLASPHHRENMLSPAWREVGLGAIRELAAPGVYAGRNITIVTADFGVRR